MAGALSRWSDNRRMPNAVSLLRAARLARSAKPLRDKLKVARCVSVALLRAKVVCVLQQRFGRFDPKGQCNGVVIHHLKQKSLRVATCGNSPWSRVCERFADAGRNRQGRLRRMRGRL